ncbi:hypothetical protein FJV41_36165 [Myxococcus llanfairpwllgwyngyllgogerychwyrndrobwllllantysiliogogogochensis]|uniref:Lipoprotein n=1 Tax=Myxococcus llanfairpwllgwyngyllgogerychwyrndrobwllllantysiliogogogochensis TaxID=2590453 RepID=A0A540WPZ1_9BACT|nr:hypothetical protein [Myxococcus llanfairpwllgwyngyllgogerychwyrndrobwllllantysiliogogogochensis]TQF11066.1 hypothetical protein FJV41_36165 [Myxococcus llanfairpwllgwyngyllgogerychwyrndrobwllllantysiliogogogochensis]
MAHAAWKWVVVAAAVGAGVLACSDDDDGGGGGTDGGPITFDAGVNKQRPGFGEDPGAPVGTTFAFPPGVEIAGELYGANDSTKDCGNGVAPVGTGPAVLVCVPLRNNTGAPVLMTFEPGLVMMNTAPSRIQNGMLMDRVLINLPPTGIGPGGIDAGTDGGTEEEVYVVPFHLYCLNQERAPSEQDGTFAFGPVSTDPDIQELLRLLRGKTIDNEDEANVVQDAIYSITEYNGLTDDDRKALAGL